MVSGGPGRASKASNAAMLVAVSGISRIFHPGSAAATIARAWAAVFPNVLGFNASMDWLTLGGSTYGEEEDEDEEDRKTTAATTDDSKRTLETDDTNESEGSIFSLST